MEYDSQSIENIQATKKYGNISLPNSQCKAETYISKVQDQNRVMKRLMTTDLHMLLRAF